MASASASSRVMKKLEASLEAGQFYEAHQLYRTLYFRYLNQGNGIKTLNLLHDGVLKLVEYSQLSSASDLANLYVQTLEKCNTPVEKEILSQIEHIFNGIAICEHSDNPDLLADRQKFVSGILKWSMKVGEDCDCKRRGHPNIHLIFATAYWQEQNHAQARYHFIHSDAPEKTACFLVDFHQKSGLAGEVDLFIAQAVMQLLCYSKIAHAQTVFNSYTHDHPMITQVRKLELFSMLVEQYQPCIIRDPTYSQYLDKIGQLFFGLPPPTKPSNTSSGFLGNLLQGLLDVDDDGDESETDDFVTPQITQSLNISMTEQDLD